jgi:hypothetical protein
MSRAVVKDILQQIDALKQKDRAALERALDARIQREWKTLTKQARAKARARGITQATIDRAVEQLRYGRA